MQKLGVFLVTLLLTPCLALAAPKNKKAPQKPQTEAEREWETFKYYRARFAKDQKAHREEKIKEEKIRLAQGLPVAPDGLPVLASNPDGTNNPSASPAVEVVASPGGVTAAEGPIDPASLIEAEKKRQEEAKKAKALEAARTKLLGDARDASGQVIDEDPVLEEDEGLSKKEKRRKRKEERKKKKKRRGGEDEE